MENTITSSNNVPTQGNNVLVTNSLPSQDTNNNAGKKSFNFIKKTQPTVNTNSVIPQYNNDLSDLDAIMNVKIDEEKSDSNFSSALNKLDNLNPNTNSQSIKENSVVDENNYQQSNISEFNNIHNCKLKITT